MDRPIMLNPFGAIVTRLPVHGHLGTLSVTAMNERLPVIPYVETVELPVISFDGSAYLRGTPEQMVVSSVGSGAALTLFCDGERGDDDGPGSPDRPWRTLRHASAMLSYLECPLFAAGYQYVQLKVRAPIDVFAASETWIPFVADEHRLKLILTGVGDGRVDLGGGQYYAGYYRHIRGIVGIRGGDEGVASDCDIIVHPFGVTRYNVIAPAVAVDCRYECGISTCLTPGNIAYRCSGTFTDGTTIACRQCVCSGDFTWNCRDRAVPLAPCVEGGQLYSVRVGYSASFGSGSSFAVDGIKAARYAGNCSAKVELRASGGVAALAATGIVGYEALIQDASVEVGVRGNVTASGSSAGALATAFGTTSATVIDGGRATLTAQMTARGEVAANFIDYRASAGAELYGVSCVTHNCVCNAEASASARIVNGGAYHVERESETAAAGGGNTSIGSRTRSYDGGRLLMSQAFSARYAGGQLVVSSRSGVWYDSEGGVISSGSSVYP